MPRYLSCDKVLAPKAAQLTHAPPTKAQRAVDPNEATWLSTLIRLAPMAIGDIEVTLIKTKNFQIECVIFQPTNTFLEYQMDIRITCFNEFISTKKAIKGCLAQ